MTAAPSTLPSTVAGIVAQITSTTAAAYEADLTGAVVSYVNGKSVYLEDASGAVLAYLSDANHGLVAGDVISGKVSGTAKLYSGLPEVLALGDEFTKTSGGTIPLTEMTIADLNANFKANISRRVIIKGVTVETGIDGPANARNGKISQNGSEIVLRDENKVAVVAQGSQGDVIGFPLPYNTTNQFGIWESSHFTAAGGQTPETTISAVDKTVQVGQTVNAEVTTNSPGALSYSSDNTQIATVDNQGVITGVAAGEANITVTVAASGDYAAKSATFKVTVTAAPSTLPSTVAGIVAQITSTTAAAYEANLTGAVVSYVNGKNVYLEDTSGAVLAYLNDANHGLVAGDVISGKVGGTAKLYSGLPEVLALGDEFTKTSGGTIPLTEMTIADLNANFKANISRRVIIKGVTVETGIDGPANARNGKISQNGSEIVLRDENKVAVVAQGSQGDVIGFPLPYNTTNQFGIWESSHFTAAGGQTPETTLTAKDVTVEVGKTVNADVTTNSPGALSYSSDNTQIATVDAQGVITGVAAGEANITVTVAASGDYAAKSATFKVTVVAAPTGGNNYAKYSGAITEGDYIIYYNGKAMKNTIASNRFGYAEVTPSADVISEPDASIVWHISASGDYWVIYNAAVQKYAGSTGSKNQGKLLDAATSDNALWTVTGSATYEFENKARAAASSDPNNKWLRNNGTYGFACYATSTGGALTLFKKQ